MSRRQRKMRRMQKRRIMSINHPTFVKPVVRQIPDFAAMTRDDLRVQAKALGVVGYGHMRKGPLVEACKAAAS